MVAAPEHSLTFEQFFAEECPRLVPMLHALTGDRGRAEDLAQKSLARAHREWQRVTAYDKPGAWVRRVARNLASNTARRTRREQRALRRVSNVPNVEFTHDDERLWALVRELPDQQRWAVAMFYVEDMSVAAVAEVLEITEGTAKTYLSRTWSTWPRSRSVGRRPTASSSVTATLRTGVGTAETTDELIQAISAELRYLDERAYVTNRCVRGVTESDGVLLCV